MRRLLEKAGIANGKTSGAMADGMYWRQVPRVNILSLEPSHGANSLLIRGLLIILLAAAIFAIWAENRKIEAVEGNMGEGQNQLQAIQRQLSEAELEVEPIKAEIQGLRNQRKTAGEEYQLVTTGLINWRQAIEALLGIQAAGVTFDSVTTLPGGEVTLAGKAQDSDVISQLPAEFNGVSGILDFQGIQWDTSRVPPTFIASFKVR